MREIKSEYVGFRLTASERKKLVEKCRELGYKDISECLRALIRRL